MESILQLFRNMGQTRLIALTAVACVLLALFVYITSHVASPPMSPIYTDLSLDDSAKIVAELEKQSIPYELRGNGSQVLVPSDQMLRLRLSLAQQGLPSGGSIVGYEIFDRSETMGTSSFVMNINMLRALEGELARTISSISQVESARVSLVVPKQELFSRDKQEPTASVMLKLRGVSELTKEQISAITHLVAAAVPGLKPSKVTMIDSKGRMLAGGAGDENNASASASNANEYKLGYENHLKSTLETLLEKSIGTGKVKVTVSADIDFDRVVTNSEVYDPNGQVARSVQTGEEKEQSNEKEGKENTTVTNNLPGAQAGQTATGSARIINKTDETTNYEISKTIENHVKESGKVNKLSVAVLVDGNYTEEAGKSTYTPRSEEERKQIDTLVKSAIGYDEKRGDKVDVVNMRFMAPVDTAAAVSPFEWLKQDLHSIIQTVVFGGVAILVILLVIRPIVNRIIETTLATTSGDIGGETPALAGAGIGSISPRMPGMTSAPLTSASGGGGGGGDAQEEESSIDISRITGKVKSSTYNRLNDMVEKNPDEALNVIRQWASKR
jgi:flagellar M-ring protein FliF